MKNIIVIIPTYNERSNIAQLIELIQNIEYNSHPIDVLNEINRVSISVTDQGKGVDMAVSSKIFERFYTDRSHTSEYHSGLGLSISKKIMESFSGSIQLNSSNPEGYNGACFILKLPLKD